MNDSQIVNEFIELVKIDVQSRNERKIADVLKKNLTALGLTVTEDDVAAKLGGNTGNIIARLKGDPDIPALLLSAHMDRVSNPGNITPVIHEDTGIITSDGNSILAADNVSRRVRYFGRNTQSQGCQHIAWRYRGSHIGV